MLPLYQSHKQVRAAEIQSVDADARRIYLSIPGTDETEARRLPIMVEGSWLDRFAPKAGDWLVEYADGYRSVSPAAAFNNGHEAIDEDDMNDEWKAQQRDDVPVVPDDGQPKADAKEPERGDTPASGLSFGGGHG